MNREKSLVKNTAIYMIGNLSSKLLVFMLLPIYTVCLTTKEYGYYDIIYTTVLLIVPIVSLQIYDGIYRFVLDAQNDTLLINKFISNALALIGIAFLITIPLILILQVFADIQYLFLIYLQIIITSIFNTWQMIARGLKKNILYAISGIIMTAVMLILNVLFIVILHFSIQALIVSNILALVIAVLFLEYKLGVLKIFKIQYIDKVIIKELFSYSMPLIPNSISWWILNLSNRYIISFYLGNDYNGIYAVASKFPAIIMTVNMIFNLAWQDAAICEKNSEDRDQFYSKMFNYFLELQLVILIIIIPSLRIFTHIAIGKEFSDSINYIPILMLSAFFQFFATFFCSFYYVNKKTAGLLYTTLVGAATNIVLTFILIKNLELYAACIANVVSTIIVVSIRYVYITKKLKISIQIKLQSLLIHIAMCGLYCVIYYKTTVFINGIALFIGMLGLAFLYKAQLIKYKGRFLKQKISYK